MKIDTKIVDMFLQGECESNIKNHWIFSCINDGETLFEMPSKDKKDVIKAVCEQAVKNLNEFLPYNNRLFNSIFSNVSATQTEEVYVYLIVGAPKPYDAMCRTDTSGRLCIIFDLVRIAEYGNNVNDLQGIMNNLITHELTHIYLHNNYPFEAYSDDFKNRLIYLTFDEGFAHYLSLSDNILDFDLIKYEDKWGASVKRFQKTFTDDIDDPEKILFEANTGSFWEKFGAISGMVGIFMYVNGSENPYDRFVELYMKGPGYLCEYIRGL